jgi:hypothetical protein
MLVHLHMLAVELHILVHLHMLAVEFRMSEVQLSTLVEHLHQMVGFYILEEVDLKKLKPEYLN